MRRSLFAACLAAAVLIIAGAAPAGAATTLRGRIAGEPQVSGVHARVPLVLGNGAEAVVTVPATSGFRTVTRGRTAADRTRLGDAVSARVGALRGGRARAKYLKIVRRSAAPPFGDLHVQLRAASRGAHQATDEIGRITAAAAGGPQDPGTLRFLLLALRARLNTLISSLRDQADNMDEVTDAVKGARALARQLDDAARGARSAAAKLEDGVTGLDEFINSIGGSPGVPLPAATVGIVGQVLDTALQILDGLAPHDGLPGAPALPDPLGGVPVPAGGAASRGTLD